MSGFLAEQEGAEVRVSANFGPRRDGMRPEMIVLHYTGMRSGAEAEVRLCDPASEVSSHYLVHEDGCIVQMVREADRAWHAGKSSWQGETDVNSRSIGVEIVNPGHGLGYGEFPARQVDAVIALCKDISSRHAIPPQHVLAHSDVAPGRKIDPGEKFPWRRLAAAGIGHFVEPSPMRVGNSLALGAYGKPVEELQSMLEIYGYGVEISGRFDLLTKTVVEAFQRHFRPERVDGVADISTGETLCRLLAALPKAGS